MMPHPHSISVIIPVYNEEENIRNTLRTALASFPQICPEFELIIVESGSTDNSLRIILEEAEQHENLHVLNQEKKKGMGSALREGYRLCSKEWICHLEADLPFDLEYAGIASEYFDDYDFIRGYRTGRDGHSNSWIYSEDNMMETFVRGVFHYGYNAFVKLMFNVSVRDINFSFKFVRNSFIKKLDLRANGWFIDTELVLELQKAQARFKEIPIRYNMRENGQSTVGLVSPAPIVKDALRYRLSRWKTGNALAKS